MREEITKHLLTIFLKSDNEELNRIMISEDEGIMHHIDAFRNIEKKLNLKYRIPYISKSRNNLEDVIYNHTQFRNIIVSNLSSKEHKCIFIYLPEQLEDIDIQLINNILNELDGINIYIFRQNGEVFVIDNKDKYLQNKQKNLTNNLQN